MKAEHGTLNVPNDPTPWVIVRPNTKKDWAVLWLQGWGNSITSHLATIEKLAEESGATFAMLDFAGHGTHKTPLRDSTKQMQHIEVLAAYDELKSDGYANIIVIGGSFGAYMAALLSGKRSLAAIILRAPSVYPNNEFSLPYSKTLQYREDALDVYGFEQDPAAHLESTAFEAIAGYDGPVYVIEHDADEVIPVAVPLKYFSVSKHANYLRVPGAKHSPKVMDEPRKYYDYIEHMLVSIIKLIQLTP